MNINEIIDELILLDGEQELEVIVDGSVCGKVFLVCKGEGEHTPYLEVREDDSI